MQALHAMATTAGIPTYLGRSIYFLKKQLHQSDKQLDGTRVAVEDGEEEKTKQEQNRKKRLEKGKKKWWWQGELSRERSKPSVLP